MGSDATAAACVQHVRPRQNGHGRNATYMSLLNTASGEGACPFRPAQSLNCLLDQPDLCHELGNKQYGAVKLVYS